MKRLDYIIEQTLSKLIEQEATPDTKKETDNAPSDADVSPFTPAEEKFLGKFDAYGSTHIGIIYSTTDIGIREFIARSGNEFNLSPGILLNLLRNNVIKIVPYTGYGRNTDYTIELQLTLDDVKGLGAADKEKAEAGSAASGATAAAGEMTTPMPPSEPAPELSWVIPYGELIKESVIVAKRLIETKNQPKTDIDTNKSRILKKLPKSVIIDLERLIDKIAKASTTAAEKQRLVADIIDNLVYNLKLTPKQIQRSYEYHKTQKRLQESLHIDLYEHANMLIEQSIDDSAQVKYLQANNVGIDKLIDNAAEFWNGMSDVFSGIGAVALENWDESKFFNLFNKYVFSSADARKQALIIDAIGTIVLQAKGTVQMEAAPAGKFLKDWIGKEWSVLLPLPIKLPGSSIISLSTLLDNNLVISYILNESYFATWNQNLTKKGIGQVIKSSNTKKKFFPTYKSTEIMSWVNRLLAPYQTNVKTSKDSAGKSTITKVSAPTFADTLSKEEKIKRGKAAKEQIKKNIDKFIVNMPDGQSKENVRKLVDSFTAWVDSSGYGYIVAQPAGSTKITRLYPAGEWESFWHQIDIKTGKTLDYGQPWYWEWSSTDKKWNLVGMSVKFDQKKTLNY